MHNHIHFFIIIFFCIRLNPLTGQETTSSIIPKTNDSRWKHSSKIPSEFDAREQWKMCTIIRESMLYRGQSENSWAVATSSVLADRICISQGGKFNEHISVNELMFCGCSAYHLERSLEYLTQKAWEHYRDFGGLSEPHYNYYGQCPENSKIDPKFRQKVTNVYTLQGNDEIKKDIFTYGPVSALRRIYDNEIFNGNMLFIHNRNSNPEGYKLQVIKIIGWGTEGAFDYWLCVNSSGDSWADNGVFKINMSKDFPNIVERVIAGEPFVDKKSLNFFQKWFC